MCNIKTYPHCYSKSTGGGLWIAVQYSMLVFSVFSAIAYPIDQIFTMCATTHVECFNDTYGHVVWQPCWKKVKTVDLSISETAPWETLKLGTCQVFPMGNVIFFF